MFSTRRVPAFAERSKHHEFPHSLPRISKSDEVIQLASSEIILPLAQAQHNPDSSGLVGSRATSLHGEVKTAETEYMQRRLMKALEDLSLKYDLTVRTSDRRLSAPQTLHCHSCQKATKYPGQKALKPSDACHTNCVRRTLARRSARARSSSSSSSTGTTGRARR